MRKIAMWTALLAAVSGCAQQGTVQETPFAEAARERQFLVDSVTSAVMKRVEAANAGWAAINGKTFLYRVKLDRAVVFVPNDGGLAADPRVTEGGLLIPPAGSTRSTWSDQIATAQQVTAWYELGAIRQVRRGDSLERPYEAVVEVALHWKHASARSEQIQGVPRPLQGQRYWRPLGIFGRVGKANDSLPVASLQGRSDAMPGDDLTRQALETMEQMAPTETTEVLTLHMAYDLASSQWVFAQPPPTPQAFGQIETVTWYTGLPDDAGYVFFPGDLAPAKNQP